MGIDINIINWLKLQFDQENEQCHRKIEFCLIRTFSELKNSQMKEIKISTGFDDRLFSGLNDITDNKETIKDKIIQGLIYNKKLNYALAVSLLTILFVFIILNGDNTHNKAESATVVKSNASFTDHPSSQIFISTNEENEFIDEIKAKPENLQFLIKLEKYYIASGKKQTAADIGEFIDRVR